jgi:hypothetical protein
MIAPGAALLSPRGQVLENGAPRFFRRLGEGIFDEVDVVRRAHALVDFIAAARGLCSRGTRHARRRQIEAGLKPAFSGRRSRSPPTVCRSQRFHL